MTSLNSPDATNLLVVSSTSVAEKLLRSGVVDREKWMVIGVGDVIAGRMFDKIVIMMDSGWSFYERESRTWSVAASEFVAHIRCRLRHPTESQFLVI